MIGGSERYLVRKIQPNIICFEDENRSGKPTNLRVRGPRNWKEQNRWFFSKTSKNNSLLPTPWS